MKVKRKGRRLLESAGYCCVRSGGSLGVFDVVGVGSTDIVVVPGEDARLARLREMEQLESFPCPANCRRLVHRWRDRMRLPDLFGDAG